MNSVIFVGMDVHKETIVLAGMRGGNQFAEFVRTIRNEPGQVKKFLTVVGAGNEYIHLL